MTPSGEKTAIRKATPQDAGAIQAIYAHHVLNGLGTFEEVPPDVAEMTARMASVAAQGMPWLVAESDGSIVAYAYAAPFRPRSAYRFTVENSVYVAPDRMGCGFGSRLLNSLVDECRSMGIREMLAVIGDSGNAGSISLHAKCGFEHQGLLKQVGLKFGRWIDVVIMQRTLSQYRDN